MTKPSLRGREFRAAGPPGRQSEERRAEGLPFDSNSARQNRQNEGKKPENHFSLKVGIRPAGEKMRIAQRGQSGRSSTFNSPFS